MNLKGMPFASEFEFQLYAWADEHLRPAAIAIEEAWLDVEQVRSFIARVFRRRVEREPAFIYGVVDSTPDDLLTLSELIGELQLKNEVIPADGWREWVKTQQIVAYFQDERTWRVPLVIPETKITTVAPVAPVHVHVHTKAEELFVAA